MYSTEIDGEVFEFGTSGFLFRSNKLMYDRKTETLWHQFRGEPVVGPLVGSGIKLKVIPMVLTTWSAWVSSHPDTTVLDIDTGIYGPGSYRPESDSGSVYFNYRNTGPTMFPVARRSGEFAAKEQMFGVVFGGSSKAYPKSVLSVSPVINDTVGAQALVVVTREELGTRAYARVDHLFEASPEGGLLSNLLIDEVGAQWRVEEDALVNIGRPSEQLERLPSRDAFWFGWFAFYPETAVYRPVP